MLVLEVVAIGVLPEVVAFGVVLSVGFEMVVLRYSYLNSDCHCQPIALLYQ